MTIDSAAGSPVPPCVLVLGRDLAAARAYAARLVHAGYRAVAGVPALDSAPVAALLLGGEGESEGTAWAEAVAPLLGDLPSRIETGPLPEDFAGLAHWLDGLGAPVQERRVVSTGLVLSEVADGEAAAGGLLAAADFERRLGVELARCQRYGRVLSFGLLDPDGLSALRSRSPAAADRVLRQLARFTVAHLRRTDVSGRCGAGGIGVLLTETTAARGLGVFERLRVGFVQGQLRVQPRVPAVSLSIGVVECRGERDAAGVLAVAQTAVEAARAAGEDCVRLAPAA
ncbi:MAG TPA: diguanylate cyclase [Plasticicumulans sp.]|uniref:GGDEF domain-containing protein n=1 Tax=Plasticicumulans sp. TaxID=2307179 RepID=UPI000FA13031|nr:diguanylate cyclase [Plasticicumulans sp.]MBS0601697.1 diguanylate cyclase [Pseudomonadota bacterium]RTL02352.1 MAG: diguanylate cyclase [Xanthomonadales bacterium]HMW28235.1 diguanylate cyclase [Plasticicumulans sp.]HNJ06988.1 diguanylate cyclase [Plasticicumulans sp.]HNO59837.1 diguanylate cyclase [Plasticicumulans sp.]